MRIPEGTQGLHFDQATVKLWQQFEDEEPEQWRELIQRYALDDGAGYVMLGQVEQPWYPNFYADHYAAEPATVDGQEGYMVGRQYGWWHVYWQHGEEIVSLNASSRASSFWSWWR